MSGTRSILTTKSRLKKTGTPFVSVATLLSVTDCTMYRTIALGDNVRLPSVTVSFEYSSRLVSVNLVSLSGCCTFRGEGSVPTSLPACDFIWSRLFLQISSFHLRCATFCLNPAFSMAWQSSQVGACLHCTGVRRSSQKCLPSRSDFTSRSVLEGWLVNRRSEVVSPPSSISVYFRGIRVATGTDPSPFDGPRHKSELLYYCLTDTLDVPFCLRVVDCGEAVFGALHLAHRVIGIDSEPHSPVGEDAPRIAVQVNSTFQTRSASCRRRSAPSAMPFSILMTRSVLTRRKLLLRDVLFNVLGGPIKTISRTPTAEKSLISF